VVVVGLAVVLVVVGVAAATGNLPFFHHAWHQVATTLAISDAGADPQQEAGATDASGDGARPDAGVVQHKQVAPLSSAQLGAPLVHGSFVTACGAPENMKVVVKVTVQKGRAADVNVDTDPPDTAVCRCVDDAVRQLRWDISPKKQQLTVRY
jgi:hypothetical protein